MKTITVCGSGKFKSYIIEVCDALSGAGLLVLRPPLHDMEFASRLTEEQCLLAWKGATLAHIQRVAIGDICLLINRDGYLGVGTTLELGCAVALRKLVVSLRLDPEAARNSLINFVLGTEDVPDLVSKMVEIAR